MFIILVKSFTPSANRHSLSSSLPSPAALLSHVPISCLYALFIVLSHCIIYLSIIVLFLCLVLSLRYVLNFIYLVTCSLILFHMLHFSTLFSLLFHSITLCHLIISSASLIKPSHSITIFKIVTSIHIHLDSDIIPYRHSPIHRLLLLQSPQSKIISYLYHHSTVFYNIIQCHPSTISSCKCHQSICSPHQLVIPSLRYHSTISHTHSSHFYIIRIIPFPAKSFCSYESAEKSSCIFLPANSSSFNFNPCFTFSQFFQLIHHTKSSFNIFISVNIVAYYHSKAFSKIIHSKISS